MPGCPRSQIVDFSEVGCYHCFSRCVRRAFLCGEDPYTEKNYDHRKGWLEQRLKFVASCMALDVIGAAILDNHYHVVLRNRPDLVEKWSDREVARRWLMLYPGTRRPTQQPIQPTEEQIAELLADDKKLAAVRQRLSSLSWFMKFVNEDLARRSNAEDEVSGAFWEERFKSTRLLDAFAILLCAMYVDLNLIRAQIAETPEASRYTSAFLRIQARQARLAQALSHSPKPGQANSVNQSELEAACWLAPVDVTAPPPDGAQAELGRRASDHGFLEMTLDDYLSLLDWSGRQLRCDKRGAIPAHLGPILERLQVDVDFWLAGLENFRDWYRTMAGRVQTLVKHARENGRRWFQGVGKCPA